MAVPNVREVYEGGVRGPGAQMRACLCHELGPPVSGSTIPAF